MTEMPKIIGGYYKAGYFFENYLLEQAGADAESTMLTDIIPGLSVSIQVQPCLKQMPIIELKTKPNII